jgi:hypothetical protein
MDLPEHVVNQCVILVFEAMEKSRNGNVTQYIDRIRITAKRDIELLKILTSDLDICHLQNKDLKVILKNQTDPVLDYSVTPIDVVLEVTGAGTSQTFTQSFQTNVLAGFDSNIITMMSGFNFDTGTYKLKAYFTSVLDDTPWNDTLETSIVINPDLSVQIKSESTPNCLAGELVVHPSIVINNTGSMDLSNIDLIIRIDTGENNLVLYSTFKEIYTDTILAGSSATYTFANSYIVPWNALYDVRVYAFLSCDSALVNATNRIQECVDMKDLRIMSIDNPAGTKDVAGSSIQVTATVNNRYDGDVYNNIPLTVRITNSQGVETETFYEAITVEASATVRHTFNRTYIVPADSVYYVTVYVNSQDNYRHNDTVTTRRETDFVGIETLNENVFNLGQNIPNPVTNTTRIDYSIPEAGEVVFHLRSASGQLLYSQTIEAANGKHSLELNTTTLAAGVYFYSIEYKGQRLVKRMSKY